MGEDHKQVAIRAAMKAMLVAHCTGCPYAEYRGTDNGVKVDFDYSAAVGCLEELCPMSKFWDALKKMERRIEP